MATKLTAMLEPQKNELIAGKAAKRLFDLANKQLNNCKTIDIQSARLDLLENMLSITTQLESRPPLSDIMYASLLSLQTHLKAEQGLVVILNHNGSNEITHSIGATKSSCYLSICNRVQATCQSISKEQCFKVLSPHCR